jgi:hypothetical protein
LMCAWVIPASPRPLDAFIMIFIVNISVIKEAL